MLHTLQQRIPEGLSFRVTGEDGNNYWREIRTANDLAGDFDIEVSANSSTSNPQIEEQRSLEILQLVSNPLDIQLGIVTPRERFEAIKNRMRKLGVKDFSKFIREPRNIQRDMSPEEELNRVLRGVEVPVTPEMDHQGYIDMWDNIKGDDELLGQFNEEQTLAAEAQSRRHQAMLEALQAQEAQQRNVQQQAINAQLASQQAQPGAPAIAPQQGEQAGGEQS